MASSSERSERADEGGNAAPGADPALQQETFFMDLPDDILLNIFSFLDLPSRLKLRLNKRLDRLHFAVKTRLKRIIFHTIGFVPLLWTRRNNHVPVNSSNCIEWEKSLRRFTMNTTVQRISINVEIVPNEEHSLIDALFHFKAYYLEMIAFPSGRMPIPHLTLPSFLILAHNFAHVRFELTCPSLSAKDLCVIRQTMLSGSVMKSFEMAVGAEMGEAFMEECFGLTIEEVSKPGPGMIYRSTDESLELYQLPFPHLVHCEGDFRTEIIMENINGTICFLKSSAFKKPPDLFKIKLNQLYLYH